jgi:hypothetical protein
MRLLGINTMQQGNAYLPEFILDFNARFAVQPRSSNAALGKAPVRRVTTQNNPVFAVLYAVFKLECLKMKQHLSYFALRTHLYLKAIRVAFDELQTLKVA